MKKLLLLFIVPLNCLAQQPIQYVDPLVGTAPATTESARKHSEASSELKGQTFPGVGRPFGMTQWTPETRRTELKCISPYYYNDKFITGFRGSHWMSGSCTQDYGSATLMPFTSGLPDTISTAPVSRFNHRNEMASPSYYRLLLDSYNVVSELTGSVRSGMMRFTFPGKNRSCVFIRINSDEKAGRILINRENNEIALCNPVHRIYQGSGQLAGFSGWFVIRFDKPFNQINKPTDNQQIALSFSNQKSVNVRIGTSFTSIENARKNLETEIPDWDFEKLRKSTE
ncbi:MAG: glycoside hydrolase family 92 protein, partial [Bacteroidia bacterium]